MPFPTVLSNCPFQLRLKSICFFSISQSTKLWSRPETRASRYGEGAYTEKAKDIINFQETVARAAEKRSKLQFFCKYLASAFLMCNIFIFECTIFMRNILMHIDQSQGGH